MMATTSAPRLYLASSLASGRFTLMTMSASLSASALTVAPAAVNSESGRPDLTPAPGSPAISTPTALNFFTVSGEAATRGSDGSISLATAIFMGPPARGARASKLAPIPQRWIPVLRPECVQFSKIAPPGGGASGDVSGQENRHHGEDEDDGGGAVFHQLDEALIGLLMGRIIVAVSGRVGHFVMLCHRSPRSMLASRVQLPQSVRESNGGGRFVVHQRRPYLSDSAGQLSLIQRVRLSSLTSPAARERMMAVALSGGTRKSISLRPRNTMSAPKAARLLPSTNG